jgi:Domain of unknown function (DUF927)
MVAFWGTPRPMGSRMMRVCVAFSGPLLHPLNAESGGFHFVGNSSIGKTSTLLMAGLIWGGGGTTGYLRSWRATDNGLEGLAGDHCDCLLCLDEMGQVNPRAAGQAAYMLANGAGKPHRVVVVKKSILLEPEKAETPTSLFFETTATEALVDPYSPATGTGPKLKARLMALK